MIRIGPYNSSSELKNNSPYSRFASVADIALRVPAVLNYLHQRQIPLAVKPPFWKLLAAKTATQQRNLLLTRGEIIKVDGIFLLRPIGWILSRFIHSP
jgi:hypothetical protein